MADKAPAATAPPDAKKTEKKQLTEVQKLKLFNVHLNQRIAQLESEKVKQMQTIVALQAQIQEHKSAATNSDAEKVYKELGIAQGDEIELHADGTLLINPPTLKQPEKVAPLMKVGPKKNGDRRTGPRPLEARS
jgi:uncharacterized coiled-coil protein SlyX